MKMKIILGLVLVSVMAISFGTLSSCNNVNSKSNDTTEIKKENTENTETNKEEPVAVGLKGEVKEENTATGKVITLTTADFKKLIFDYENGENWKYNGTRPAVIDFYADWCRPCKMVAPIMDELAKEYKGKVDIYKLDVDAEGEVASVFGIQSIPSILYIPVSGEPQMGVGAMPKEEYVKEIEKLLSN